jgi:protein-S-isoprenylcysteine O-methyltransferase Ste14
MNAFELKVPPPLVLLLLAGLMWLIAQPAPPPDLPFALRLTGALVLACIGEGIGIAGILACRRARTTVNPLRPGNTVALVDTGVFRLTRNPMYLGMLLTLTGWGVYLSQAWPLLCLPVFVAYIYRFQIVPEERVLRDKFGAAFASYTERVRRWV